MPQSDAFYKSRSHGVTSHPTNRSFNYPNVDMSITICRYTILYITRYVTCKAISKYAAIVTIFHMAINSCYMLKKCFPM